MTTGETSQRPERKSRIATILGVSLVACLAFAFLFLRVAGLRTGSSLTATYVESIVYEPIPPLKDGTTSDLPGLWADFTDPEFRSQFWSYEGARYFDTGDINAQTLQSGQTQDGREAILIGYKEAAFNDYLNYWFADDIGKYGMQSLEVDFTEEGLTLNTTVKIAGAVQQDVSVVAAVDMESQSVVLIGVSIGDQWFWAEEGSPIDSTVQDLLSFVTNTMQMGRLSVEEGSTPLQLSDVYVDEDQLVLLFTE